MKLLRHGVRTLLVCCSALWVISSFSKVTASPPGGNIHSMSLSPWSWRSTTVKDQIPSTLWEAECSSSFCSSPNPGQADGYKLNSVPIHQEVLVLNQLDGGQGYVASYRVVAVGCTCVWAKTDQN